MKAVWPDTIVEESALSRNIYLLRRALGESPDEHRYIVTAPGRGYRFVAGGAEATADVAPKDPQGHAADPAALFGWIAMLRTNHGLVVANLAVAREENGELRVEAILMRGAS